MLKVLLPIALGVVSLGPKDPLGKGLWMNLVRLTDQAIREHTIARNELAKWNEISAPQFSSFFQAVDALEQCVIATHPVDQRVSIGLGHPTRWIVSEPVLDVVNCLEERLNRVYRGVGAAFSPGIC